MRVNKHFFDGEKVKDQVFGGFCTCGGTMYQKIWFKVDNNPILVSECEKCWRNEAMTFNSTTLVKREEIEVVDRRDFKDLLLKILTEKEYKTIQAKWRNEEYNPSTLSNAKKKLELAGLALDEITGYI